MEALFAWANTELAWMVFGAAVGVGFLALRKTSLLVGLAVAWYPVLAFLPQLYGLAGASSLVRSLALWGVWLLLGWGASHTLGGFDGGRKGVREWLMAAGGGALLCLTLAYWFQGGIALFPAELVPHPSFVLLPTEGLWGILWSIASFAIVWIKLWR
ncbi:MAG: hypothetical protein KatS3mg100_438 [Candidatus Parcubacteria bacterium]|nr:MAG: hypothetical protein KatS3mg100_438 [Candidatus Parcubacteria bacterium]